MTTVERFDVAVVGGGPAGTAAAALVAQAGWSVVVLERERFPRFHIGESLLPSCLPVLARVGLDLEKLGYLRKLGAEFHDEAIGETSYFPFADALPGPPRFAYQVERDRFDTDLADAARRSGATVREGVTVFEHAVGDDAVELRFAATPPGSGPDEGRSGSAELRPGPDRAAASVVRARYLVDASGRRGLLSRGGRDVLVIPGLGRAASFVHYDGLDDDAWAELAQRGDVKVLRIEDGWLWAIPLAGRRLSIGAVLRTSPIAEDRVLDEVDRSPLLSRLIRGARVSAPRRIADYSYASSSTHDARRVAIGDAAGFLDPVFSSGVAIALSAASTMAELLVSALARGTEADPLLMRPLSDRMNVAYRTFHAIAHRFYNSRMFDNLFFGDVPDAVMRSGFISLLGGDVWRDDNLFQTAVLGASRRTLAAMPWSEAAS